VKTKVVWIERILVNIYDVVYDLNYNFHDKET